MKPTKENELPSNRFGDYYSIELLVHKNVVMDVVEDLSKLIEEVDVERVPALIFAGKAVATIYRGELMAVINDLEPER